MSKLFININNYYAKTSIKTRNRIGQAGFSQIAKNNAILSDKGESINYVRCLGEKKGGGVKLNLTLFTLGTSFLARKSIIYKIKKLSKAHLSASYESQILMVQQCVLQQQAGVPAPGGKFKFNY